MQPNEQQSRPVAFYFLMAFLAFLTSFIGYNFGHIPGALIGFLFSLIVNIYALKIKFD
jgi:4-hydroxybenzoate polyprenyltransferase